MAVPVGFNDHSHRFGSKRVQFEKIDEILCRPLQELFEWKERGFFTKPNEIVPYIGDLFKKFFNGDYDFLWQKSPDHEIYSPQEELRNEVLKLFSNMNCIERVHFTITFLNKIGIRDSNSIEDFETLGEEEAFMHLCEVKRIQFSKRSK